MRREKSQGFRVGVIGIYRSADLREVVYSSYVAVWSSQVASVGGAGISKNVIRINKYVFIGGAISIGIYT
jgi:hypothetical protein